MYLKTTSSIKPISDAEKAGAVPPSKPLLLSASLINYPPLFSSKHSMIFDNTSAAQPYNDYSDYDDDSYDEIDNHNFVPSSIKQPLQSPSIQTKSLFSNHLQNSQPISNSSSIFGASIGNGNYLQKTSIYGNSNQVENFSFDSSNHTDNPFETKTEMLNQTQIKKNPFLAQNTKEALIPKSSVNQSTKITNHPPQKKQSVPNEIKFFQNDQNNLFQQIKTIKNVQIDEKSSESDSEKSFSQNSSSVKIQSSDQQNIAQTKSQNLINLEEKPISDQTVFLPLIEIPNHSQESKETIKTEKKTISKINKEEENELEIMRSRIKELETLNKNYLKVITDLSETVKNLSIGIFHNSQNEKQSKKVEGQNKELDKKNFGKKINIFQEEKKMNKTAKMNLFSDQQ